MIQRWARGDTAGACCACCCRSQTNSDAEAFLKLQDCLQRFLSCAAPQTAAFAKSCKSDRGAHIFSTRCPLRWKRAVDERKKSVRVLGDEGCSLGFVWGGMPLFHENALN